MHLKQKLPSYTVHHYSISLLLIIVYHYSFSCPYVLFATMEVKKDTMNGPSIDTMTSDIG